MWSSLTPKRVPPDINHSHYTALTIKNALVDSVRTLRGDRPCVDLQNAQVPLVAMVRGAGPNTSLSLYKCLHPPGSLHRRGYRANAAMHKAAMKESMAAGLLLAAGWKDFLKKNNTTTLVDPMAGSGSFVLEAAMMAADLAPGLMRIKCGMEGHSMPPVVQWKSNENIQEIWKEVLVDATRRAKKGIQRLQSSDTKIIANDIHPGALDLLEESLQQAGLQSVVEIHEGDCQDFIPTAEPCFVVTNPPWGVRLTDEMHESWESLRVFLRENCAPNTEAWVLSGNKAATKHLGLRRSQSMGLQTGQQDLRWLQYKILDRAELAQSRNENDEKDQISKKHDPEHERVQEPSRMRSERETNRAEIINNPQEYRRYAPQERREQESRPRQQSRPSRDNASRGYERRSRVASADNKSVTKPLTDAEREERKNSWYV